MARDKVDVAERMVDAGNRRDVDGAFAEIVTPDFEWWPALTRALEGGSVYRRSLIGYALGGAFVVIGILAAHFLT